MIIREKDLLFRKNSTIFYLDQNRHSLFFDIETTGLSWRRSRLYLIGAVYYSGGGWRLKQWFLESPLEEPQLLRDFAEFLRGFSTVIHYNGLGFDIPYLTRKYADYRMDNPLERVESLDLYRILKPWQKTFGLPSLKQKNAEEFFGISRDDTKSGGELISCYEEYLKTAGPELLELLLLHNHDDLLGLAELLPVTGYRFLSEGSCALRSAEIKEGELSLSLGLDHPLPAPVRLDHPHFRLQAEDTSAVLAAGSCAGEMKHFFENWKDYYYLPLEDCAVHKSVGIYVDKNCRQKATARNCYQRCSGIFLPQPAILFHPVFYRDYGGTPAYFQFREEFLQDRDALTEYARSLLRCLP